MTFGYLHIPKTLPKPLMGRQPACLCHGIPSRKLLQSRRFLRSHRPVSPQLFERLDLVILCQVSGDRC